jgi:hypothetical protein
MEQTKVYIRGSLRLPVAGGPDQLRRADPRHIPVERQVWLAWQTDQSVHRVPARLLDISRGGAAVEVDADVPPNQSLLFGLGGSSETDDFLGATVVRIAAARLGGYRIHLAFTTKCPDALLKTALFGARGAVRRPLLAALAATFWSFAEWARRILP